MNERIRTVLMNPRGQIVIPEDVRQNLKMKPKEALILIEKGNELILKKESDVVKTILEEDNAWAILSFDALKKAWGKEDAVWDKIACEEAQ
jgi:AbrB family looped-hinge helix DNA binding protein